MTALPSVENKKMNKKNKKEGRRPVPDRSPIGTPCPAAYLQITPSLTSPTLVFSRNTKTASVYLLLDSNSLTVVFLVLALPA